MFVPDDNGRTFYLRVNMLLVRVACVFLLIFLAGVAALMLKSAEIGLKLQLVNSLRDEKSRLLEENNKLTIIARKFDAMETTTAYLRSLVAAGLNEKSAGNDLGSRRESAESVKESRPEPQQPAGAKPSEIYDALKVSSPSRGELLAAQPNLKPVEGWITQTFVRDDEDHLRNHNGIDIVAAEGTPIRVTAPGIVEGVVNDSYFGYVVTVGHKLGFTTRYAHCSQVLVSRGDHVERGQTIALVGNTGISSGPHVHYEILKGNKHIDPQTLILNATQ